MRAAGLLLLGLTQGAWGAAAFLDELSEFNMVDAVKGAPGMIRDNFRIFKTGTGAMWNNRKAAAVVRKQHKSAGARPTYPELLLLRKSSDDTQKLVQAGIIYIVVPELLPAMLYFFPRSIPSTFETAERRGRRYDTLVRLRAKAVLDMAVRLEDDAAVKKGKAGKLAVERSAEAERLLRAPSLSAATAPLAKYLPPATSAQAIEVGKAPLKGMPQPFVKAGCTLIGLSGPLPGFIRRRELRKHLQHVRDIHCQSAAPQLGSCPTARAQPRSQHAAARRRLRPSCGQGIGSHLACRVNTPLPVPYARSCRHP
jgi:hypothetical protein